MYGVLLSYVYHILRAQSLYVSNLLLHATVHQNEPLSNAPLIYVGSRIRYRVWLPALCMMVISLLAFDLE